MTPKIEKSNALIEINERLKTENTGKRRALPLKSNMITGRKK